LELEKLALGKQVKPSRDAGDYVCNFSMYVILDYMKRYCPTTRFGFIHIPHAYDAKRAVKFVRKVLNVLNGHAVGGFLRS